MISHNRTSVFYDHIDKVPFRVCVCVCVCVCEERFIYIVKALVAYSNDRFVDTI